MSKINKKNKKLGNCGSHLLLRRLILGRLQFKASKDKIVFETSSQLMVGTVACTCYPNYTGD
jgi:hypothetical protein